MNKGKIGEHAAIDYGAVSARTWAAIAYVVGRATSGSHRAEAPAAERRRHIRLPQPVVAVLFTVAAGLGTCGAFEAGAAGCLFAGVWLVTQSKSRAQLEVVRTKPTQ